MTNSKLDTFFSSFLIYSDKQANNESEKRKLEEVKHRINNDPFLSQNIKLICADNPTLRNYLKYNKTGVIITSWPVFVLKYPSEPPKLFSIWQVDHVISEIYLQRDNFEPVPVNKLTEPLCSSVSKGATESGSQCFIPWSKTQLKRIFYTQLGSSIHFKSPDNEVHDLFESDVNGKKLNSPRVDLQSKARAGFDEVVTFKIQGTYYLASSNGAFVVLEVLAASGRLVIQWDNDAFPENGKGIKFNVKPNQEVILKSNGIHGLATADRDWNIKEVLIPPISGFEYRMNTNSGHFVCPNSPSRMRLLLVCSNDLLDGIVTFNSPYPVEVPENDVRPELSLLDGIHSGGEFVPEESRSNSLLD
jgi:hypothetical protein